MKHFTLFFWVAIITSLFTNDSKFMLLLWLVITIVAALNLVINFLREELRGSVFSLKGYKRPN